MPDASTLRDDARACFQAAVAAVDPETLIRRFLEERPELPEVPGVIRLAAIGKAGVAMARGARRVLGERLAGGVLVVPEDGGAAAPLPPTLEVFHGGHPVPNDEGVRGAEAILSLAEGLGEGDLLLCLVSGGGSALMTLPPEGVPLEDVQAVTLGLLRAGATIGELNAVRKHLDRLKGGRLARATGPARVLALVLSDVVGDPLDTIASGPVSPDPTTFSRAVGVLERRGLWPDGVPEPARRHLERGLEGREDESPAPGDAVFEGVSAHVVGNNRLAAGAALAEATARGYATALLSTLVTGEARELGRFLAGIALEAARSGHPLAPPACLVAAGETTVTVTGEGRGGRNQEVALGAAVALDELLGGGPGTGAEAGGGARADAEGGTRVETGGSPRGEAEGTGDRPVEPAGLLVASLGTDGIDGPTDAAGAVATADTLERARLLGLDARRALADNDAYPFFQALDDLLVTGPTGTNVMDVMLVLVAPGTPPAG